MAIFRTAAFATAAGIQIQGLNGPNKAGGSDAMRNASMSKSSLTSMSGARGIKTCHNFRAYYELGKEVMPTAHRGMSVQFGRRTQDGTECVVKIRHKPDCFKGRTDERDWRRGMSLLLNLQETPGMCKLFDILEDENGIYVVMERVVGVDLYEIQEHEGALDIGIVREVLRQLLMTMSHMHSHNIIHKDLKLENIMIQAAGSLRPTACVKVIDFDTVEEWSPHSAPARDIVGTNQYIAPEAYSGKYSPLSDIFSLGVVAYKLLCGKFPFSSSIFDDKAGENFVGSVKMDQIQSKLKAAVVDFSHKAFGESATAKELIQRMLSSKETQRPSAIAALRHPWFLEVEAPTLSPPLLIGQTAELMDDGFFICDEDL